MNADGKNEAIFTGDSVQEFLIFLGEVVSQPPCSSSERSRGNEKGNVSGLKHCLC